MVKFINSVADADIALVGTIVIDAYGDAFQKNFSDMWDGTEGYVATVEELFGPGTAPRPVVWTPGEHSISYH